MDSDFQARAITGHKNGSQACTRRLFVVVAGWGMAVAVGLGSLMSYSNRQGEKGDIGVTWPERSSQKLHDRLPTLLVFAHPKCPCTRATVDQLSWIMTRCGGQVACRVLFTRPESETESWTRTAIWHATDAISGVEVSTDHGGRDAKLFGAMTSGHAMLFNVSGELIFQGGITRSRGHRGDNVGCSKIVALVSAPGVASDTRGRCPEKSDSARIETTDVFGCPLQVRRARERRPVGRTDDSDVQYREG